MIFKLSINIALLGQSCADIDEHRRQLEEKVNKVIGGQSASLPASRHNSATDLSILQGEEKLQEIKDKLQLSEGPRPTSPQAPKVIITPTGTKSTPHSPTASRHQSLEDITKQVAMLQTSLDDNIILSDSTVSLISINYGHDVNLPKGTFRDENSLEVLRQRPKSAIKKRLSLNLHDVNLNRRKSLQELSINVQPFKEAIIVEDRPPQTQQTLKLDKDKIS